MYIRLYYEYVTAVLFDDIKNKLYKTDSFIKLLSKLSEKYTPPKKINGEGITISNLHGSLCSFLLDFLFERGFNKMFYIVPTNEKVINVKDDLTVINGSEYISTYIPEKTYENEDTTKSLTLLSENKNYVIITAVDKLNYKIVPKEKYAASILHLKKKEEFLFEELLQKLEEFGYEKKYFVEQPGDYAVRGGIVDIFAESFSVPVRIEFFGEMIESIREFDINNQRSIRELEEIKIPIVLSSYLNSFPDTFNNSILNYLNKDSLILGDEECLSNIVFKDFFRTYPENKIIISSFSFSTNEINFRSSPQPEFHSNIKYLYNNILQYYSSDFEIYITCSDDYQVSRLKKLIEEYEDEINSDVEKKDYSTKNHNHDYNEEFSSSQYRFKRDSEVPNDNVILDENAKSNISFSGIRKSSINNAIFSQDRKLKGIKLLSKSISNGFISDDGKVIIYTEHQIFNRYFRQYKKHRRFRSITLDELKQLKLGDLVVHRDFGIGIYSGLVTREVKGINTKSYQDFIKLTYAEGDIIYLSLNYINMISKYTSTEGYTPKLTRLGGGDWDRIKEKTKKNVENIARDLIFLYAKRKASKGIAFQPDTHWEQELEASFIYEDTPDQARATAEVKSDMQSDSPMDRLICGDVGFGKTEVAIRASFKTVLGNKQVAVLVPTTILAVQHYHTFRDRLSNFAVEVESLTRFKSRKEQKEILKKLEEGKIDIIIGTHRLLSKDVKFKDMGLLIIDEEHRFGVKAKEKLRALKPNVDTITLTATPIPRTLNFSLLGARDLSIINTPPKNRKPIITEIIKLDWSLIAEIIKKELSRGGQVYFVNDKISGIYKIADKLKQLLPNARIGVAHGRMETEKSQVTKWDLELIPDKIPELEKVIIDFIERKIDILVCTKIIESGLDIPNVNTIVINNANTFGLAELYQLRGRVGRSSQQAYAYFVTPPASTLTKSALMRLQAIEEYTELGSGFNLSMRDIEIRGVGNLLGKEQSGFIQQIGFELYLDIINETVAQLKNREFSNLFLSEKPSDSIKTDSAEKEAESTITSEESDPIKYDFQSKEKIPQFTFEHDVTAFIPKTYIEDENERINIYKQMYSSSEFTPSEFEKELKDRFGPLPQEVKNLLFLVKIRNEAIFLGFEKLTYYDNTLIIYFPKAKEHPIYSSEFLNKLFQKTSQDKSNRFTFIQTKDQFSLKITDVLFPFSLHKQLST